MSANNTYSLNDLWHERFMDIAKSVSYWSKDPSTKVGSVAVNPYNRNILSTGYNGFPRGIADTAERLNTREEKYKYVIHAEMNLLFNSAANGINLSGSSIYVWGLPVCSNCALALVQSGVSEIIIPDYNYVPEKWLESWKLSQDIFQECGILIKTCGTYKFERL